MPDADPLARARVLVERRDFPAAQQVLRDLLSRAHTDPVDADAAEGDAAVLYAAVLMHLGEPYAARGWASHGHQVSERLHGGADRRTLHALGVLAVSQHRVGSLGRAARHYAQLITLLSATDGPDSDRTLAARADAATVDHARGLCVHARAQLEEVIEAHELQHGPTHPLGIRMVARLAAMWRDCGHFDTAHELLARARSYADSTPHEEDTHRLLAAASRAPANPEHQCGLETVDPTDTSATNIFPAIVVPGPDDLIPASAPSRPFTQITTPPGQDHHPVRAPSAPSPRSSIPARQAPPTAPSQPPARQASDDVPVMRDQPRFDPSAGAAMDWPEDEIFDRAPHESPAPSIGPIAAEHSAPDLTAETGYYRPGRPAVTTLAPTGRPHPGMTPSPPRPDGLAPSGAELRLPVAIRSSPAKPRRSTAVVTVAVCAALAAVAALVATVLLVRRAEQPATATPTGSAAPRSPAPAVNRDPVSSLSIADQGDSLLVSWLYPSAAQGPLVVSLADLGQPMRPLQSLPAGTEQYTVRGLDPGKNYCVTITMAYNADQMVMATPICTSRE